MEGHQEYKIGGKSVYFPCKPYPSQFSMMDKIIKGIERRQNCLLESPTGSGKSLALLCSSLAWQTAEKAKKDQEEAEEVEKALCSCVCHLQGNEVDGNEGKKNDGPMETTVQRTDDKSISPGWPKFDFITDEDDDFKSDGPNLKSASMKSAKKSPRAHISLSYEDPENSEANIKTDNFEGATKSSKQNGTSAGVPIICSLCSCDVGNGEGKQKIKIPKIFFGTRTHKQVAQIVKELQKTAYHDTKMTILGSREHTCIHPDVSRLKNKNEGCKELLNDSGCRFKDATLRLTSQKVVKDMGLRTAWDLEDLVSMCKTKRACPYFLSRGLKDESDLIICPYNYLVDPIVREAMMINLKGHVVILDEAHNIEDSAREAASQSISQDIIMKAIKDIDSLIEQNINFADHSKLRAMLKNLDSFIEENKHKLEQKDFDKSYKVWSGFFIVAQLESLGLGPKHYPELKATLAAIKSDAEQQKEDAVRKGLKSDAVLMKPATFSVLDQMFQVMDYLYRADLKYVDDYRASLVQSYSFVPVTNDGQWLHSRNRTGGRNMTQIETYTLNFWSMNPGVAFSDFADTRSVILTSGTLSPLASFQSELGMEFKIQLETNHVIKDSQVWVGTIGQGPSGTSLQAVFRNLETFTFQDELGELVLKVCETIPHGVLCFLPSYKVLEKLTFRWQSTGLMRKIGKRKRIISEPRGSDKMDFEEQMRLFYEAVSPGSRSSDGESDESEESEMNGAVFFAVCRGKVSEGLDFADNFARAVITVGIPYPNFKDVQVDLKRKYNDQHRHSRGLLSGHEWYEIQAFRALNQALGRCIRHRHDWGALIIVDDRFVKSAPKYCKGLSKWVRTKIQPFHDFMCARDSLTEFTKVQVEAQISSETSILGIPSQSPRKALADVNGTTMKSPDVFSPKSGPDTAKKPQQNFSIFNFTTPKRGGPGSQSQDLRQQSGGFLNHSGNQSLPKSASKIDTPGPKAQPRTSEPKFLPFTSKQTTRKLASPDSSPAVNKHSNSMTPEETSLSFKNDITKTTLLPRETAANPVVSGNSNTSCSVLPPSSDQAQDKSLTAVLNPCPKIQPQTKLPNNGRKIQIQIVTERAPVGVRSRVFEIPPELHPMFGGNLNLPVSTKERLVYLVDQPASKGLNPMARLIKMSEEEKDAILKTQAQNSNSCSKTQKLTGNTVTVSGMKPDTTSAQVSVAQNKSKTSIVYNSDPSVTKMEKGESITSSNSHLKSMLAAPITPISGNQAPVSLLSPSFQIRNASLVVNANGQHTEKPLVVNNILESQLLKPVSSPRHSQQAKTILPKSSFTEGILASQKKVTPIASAHPLVHPFLQFSSISPLNFQNQNGIMPLQGTITSNTNVIRPTTFTGPIFCLQSPLPIAPQLLLNIPPSTMVTPSTSITNKTRPIFKPVSANSCSRNQTQNSPTTIKSTPTTKNKSKPQNQNLATTPKSDGLSVSHSSVNGAGDDKDAETEEEKLQIRRKAKSSKRKSLGRTSRSAKKSRGNDTASSPTTVSTKPPMVCFKCTVCNHKLIGKKLPSDFQEQRTTPPFLKDASKTKINSGSIFFSGNISRGGLQPLSEAGTGLNTKYVEQEEICVQFLYCGQCLKSSPSSMPADAVGAQVQLAAGTSARFSKGQLWLFASSVTQEKE